MGFHQRFIQRLSKRRSPNVIETRRRLYSDLTGALSLLVWGVALGIAEYHLFFGFRDEGYIAKDGCEKQWNAIKRRAMGVKPQDREQFVVNEGLTIHGLFSGKECPLVVFRDDDTDSE
jgi:hypothetical protein